MNGGLAENPVPISHLFKNAWISTGKVQCQKSALTNGSRQDLSISPQQKCPKRAAGEARPFPIPPILSSRGEDPGDTAEVARTMAAVHNPQSRGHNQADSWHKRGEIQQTVGVRIQSMLRCALSCPANLLHSQFPMQAFFWEPIPLQSWLTAHQFGLAKT